MNRITHQSGGTRVSDGYRQVSQCFKRNFETTAKGSLIIMNLHQWIVIAAWLCLCMTQCDASGGDRSYKYHVCTRTCMQATCNAMSEAEFRSKQPIAERVLLWSCDDECAYRCMWETVDAFNKDKSPVPQFHGKWPFVRLWGIQEPASVVFSVLNGLSHVYMLLKFRRLVPSQAPLYWLWHSYAAVCINAWMWSTIFHTRDKPFTEHMDYFGAVSLVTYSAFTFFVRLLGTREIWKPGLVFIAFLAFYTNHVYYLSYVKFDYGYNMKVSVIMGLMGTTCWVLWGLYVRQKQPYVIKGIAALIIMNCLAFLEVLDFPPILWTFDAHSLWHAGTAPLALLWYSFVIDDCLFMNKQREPTLGLKQD